MKITIIRWTYDRRKDKSCPIKLRHSFVEGTKKKRNYYPLDIYLMDNQWDEKSARVKQHPNAVDINLKLVDIENTIEREYLKDKTTNIEALINNIINPQKVSTPNSNTFLDYMQYYIDECRSGKILHYKTKLKLTEGYIKSFETSLARLKWYCEREKTNPTFDEITEEFHDQCMHALRYDYEMEVDEMGKITESGLAENSIGKTTKHLKRVMEYAKEKKLHTNFEFEKFVSVSQEVDNIALTEDEVDRILNLKLTNKFMIEEQERFSIAYNFLLRFNDSISINKKNILIQDDRAYLKMMTGKTKQEVIIPIMPRNLEILKKNNFRIKQTNNQNSNERVKELGRLAGITEDYTINEIRKGQTIQVTKARFEFITTHTTRRSAATNLFKSGLDLKSIQLMGGWKSMAQLENYLKIDKLENAKKLAGHAFFNR